MSRPAAAIARTQPLQILVARRPEGVEPAPVRDQPPQQPLVHRLAAEPQRRALRGGTASARGRRRRSGSGAPRTTPASRARARSHAARCSSSSSPRRSNGTPSASYSGRCQLTVGWTTRRPSESRSSVASCLASSSGWRSGAMIELATSRSRDRRRRDRSQQRERVRPRRRRVLVPGQRVVARVLGHPAGVRPRTEHDVLAHHHGVEPGGFGLDGHPNERAADRAAGTSVQFSLRMRTRRGRTAPPPPPDITRSCAGPPARRSPARAP